MRSTGSECTRLLGKCSHALLNQRVSKCEHLKRAVASLLAVTAVWTFVHLVTSSEEARRLADLCVGVASNKVAEPSRLAGYCNSASSLDVDSEDGKQLACLVGNNEYQLVHVTGVYRHGHRTPLRDIGPLSDLDKYTCSLTPAARWSGLDEVNLRRLVDRAPSVQKLTFPLHPGTARVQCRSGQLTRIGFEQHASLGDMFWNRYVHSGAVAGVSGVRPSNFFIRSTAVNRCMRSAAAFITGLRLKGEVDILTHPDSYFRELSPDVRERNTGFQSVSKLRCSKSVPSVFKETHQTEQYKLFASKTLEPLMEEFASIVGKPRQRLPEIQHMCDILQEQYCENVDSKFCQDQNHCVSPDLLRRSLDACDMTYALNYSLPLSKLLAQPLLQEIMLRLEKRLEQTDQQSGLQADGSLFALYFGHDLTITSLLVTLESFDNRWPPLASRLMFELWKCSLPNCRVHRVRILYNGRPLQGSLTDALGFVGWSSFQAFVAARQADYLRLCADKHA